jgi:dihydrofolate reductase
MTAAGRRFCLAVRVSVQYYTASSLDGFIADQDNSLGWLLQFGDGSEPDTGYAEFIAGVGALAMGSTTYEWVHRELGLADRPEAWPYAQPTWVFSSRDLPPTAGADLRFVSGDVRDVVADQQAAAGGRNIWIVGGGDLAGQYADAGLLNEIIVDVAPVTLGAGAPLLPRRIAVPPRLRLVEARANGGVFARLRYAVDLAIAR